MWKSLFCGGLPAPGNRLDWALACPPLGEARRLVAGAGRSARSVVMPSPAFHLGLLGVVAGFA
jgi:hypothetical protein